jgi:hypothetical protein
VGNRADVGLFGGLGDDGLEHHARDGGGGQGKEEEG